jgi:hypothetical protein
VPVHSDRILFELFNLEGAQAGLSWRTMTGEMHCVSGFAHDHGIAETDWRYPLIGYFGSLWTLMTLLLFCWGLFWLPRRIARFAARSG